MEKLDRRQLNVYAMSIRLHFSESGRSASMLFLSVCELWAENGNKNNVLCNISTLSEHWGWNLSEGGNVELALAPPRPGASESIASSIV